MTDRDTRLTVRYDDDLDALRAAVDEAFGDFDTMTIADADDASVFDGVLAFIVSRKDELEALRKRATEPLAKALAEVRGWYKPIETKLEAAEAHAKSELARWHEAARLARSNALHAQRKALEAGDPNAAAMTIPDEPTSSHVYVEVWEVARVVDDMVPAEYRVVDLKALGRLARETKADATPPIVPGVTWRKALRVRATRAK